MSDDKTLRTYAKMADDYAKLTGNEAVRDPIFTAFMDALPTAAHVLDLGCGPGHYAAQMAQAGIRVTATDAVPEMVALAGQHDSVTAKQATFEDISGSDIYDGIWANFSLLHAPRDDMPRFLDALHLALKPGGIFHIGLKTGEGAARDSIARLYTYYTPQELAGLLTTAGFTPYQEHKGNSVGLDGEPADWIVVHAHA